MMLRARSMGALLPGSGLAAVAALAATLVAQLHGGPQMLYALFFGMALNDLSQQPRTKPGIEFCARQVLRLGVGLLGARITATQIAGLGWYTALTVIAAVLTTIACGLLLGRRLGLSRAQGVLSGGAVAICGASAALAISAVLPRDKHHDRFAMAFKAERSLTATGATAGATAAARQPLVPWFLWLFAAMVVVNSAGALAVPWQHGLGLLSRACLVVAIAALGMKTSFMQLAQAGWRPMLLIAVETAWIAVLVLAVAAWRS